MGVVSVRYSLGRNIVFVGVCSPCGVHSLCGCSICVGTVSVGVFICGRATSVWEQTLWEYGLCVGTVSIRMQSAGCNPLGKESIN